MKPWKICLVMMVWSGLSGAQAEPVLWEQRLADVGLRSPARISGFARSADFFFALPVREPDLTRSSVRMVVRGSSELSAKSRLRFSLQQQPVAEVRVEPGRVLEVELPLSALAGRWEPSDFVQVTVQTSLTDDTDRSRCQLWDAEHLWVEVEPGSRIRSTFDSTNPDWRAVSRLPVTLRPGVALPEALDAGQLDMVMKLTSWLAYLRPWDQVQVEGLDRIEWVEPGTGSDAVQVEAEGANRIIRVAVGAAGWQTLRALVRPVELRIPGQALTVMGPVPGGRTVVEEANLGALDPAFVREQRGINLMVQTLGFDRAMFGPDASDMELELALRHTPVSREGSGYVALYLNGRLLEAKPLRRGEGTVAMRVRLRAPVLAEDNTLGLAVIYVPSVEECGNPSFFFGYQVDPGSCLRVVSRSTPVKIASVTTVAQRDFGRSQYAVVLPEKRSVALEQASLDWVRWLQRVSSRGLLEPVLAVETTADPTRPALVLDPGGELARRGRWLAKAVLRPAANEWVLAAGQKTEYALAVGEPVAVLQALPHEVGRGAILWVSMMGAGDDELIASLARRMAAQPWAGPGNVLLSRGVGPVDAIDTSNLDPRSRLVGPEQVAESWHGWRWLLLIPLWAGITWLAIWIARPRR